MWARAMAAGSFFEDSIQFSKQPSVAIAASRAAAIPVDNTDVHTTASADRAATSADATTGLTLGT